MIDVIYLGIAFVIDIILGTIFGHNFVGVNISATSNLLLIVLILTTYKKDVKHSMMFGFFIGLTLDLFNVNSIFNYALIYMLITLIVSAWSTRINDSFIELFLVVLSAIFLKEFLIYGVNVIFYGYKLNIGTWGANHLIYTLLLAIIPMTISVLIKLKIIEKEGRIKQRNNIDEKIDFRF